MDKSLGNQGAGPIAIIGGKHEMSEGGIYFAKGPEFHTKFMAQFAMPRRFELMQMTVASMIQQGELERGRTIKQLVADGYAIADEALLTERSTLDAKMGEYWELYLAQGQETDDVMSAVQDQLADHHLET